MPTVLNIKGYRFFFFSLEGNEPPHIHIEQGDKVGKFRENPVSLASSYLKNPLIFKCSIKDQSNRVSSPKVH